MLFILIAVCFGQNYRHKIEPFSFDVRKYEYPLEYEKYGTTIAMKKHIKLIPKVRDRFGGLWLS